MFLKPLSHYIILWSSVQRPSKGMPGAVWHSQSVEASYSLQLLLTLRSTAGIGCAHVLIQYSIDNSVLEVTCYTPLPHGLVITHFSVKQLDYLLT